MRKIVLLCAGGMSTSILVKKMEEAAASQNYDVEISAHASAAALRVAEDADIVLLGPQIRFQIKKIQEELSCPVEVVDMKMYGMMDGAGVIKKVKEMLGDE